MRTNPSPVIAPYATLLALNVNPRESLRNIRRLARLDGLATTASTESVDYSVSDAGAGPCSRVDGSPSGNASLLSIVNLLRDNVVQRCGSMKFPSSESAERILHEVAPEQGGVEGATVRALHLFSGKPQESSLIAWGQGIGSCDRKKARMKQDHRPGRQQSALDLTIGPSPFRHFCTVFERRRAQLQPPW